MKSNHLPDWDVYFNAFADNQIQLRNHIQKDDHIRDLFEKCRNANLNTLWASDLYNIDSNVRYKYLYKGLVICKKCGRKMTCYVGKGMGGTKYLYYRCEYCKILLPEKRITDEYLSDLNMLLQEDEMAEVSFTEMEFSEKRTTNSISKKFLYKFLHKNFVLKQHIR